MLLYSLYSFTDLIILQFIDSIWYFVSHFKESFEPDIFGLQWTVVILSGQPGIPVPICVVMELRVATENAPILHLLIMARGVSEILPKHEAALTGLVQVGYHITLAFIVTFTFDKLLSFNYKLPLVFPMSTVSSWFGNISPII